jgi:hypothetical protein
MMCYLASEAIAVDYGKGHKTNQSKLTSYNEWPLICQIICSFLHKLPSSTVTISLSSSQSVSVRFLTINRGYGRFSVLHVDP